MAPIWMPPRRRGALNGLAVHPPGDLGWCSCSSLCSLQRSTTRIQLNSQTDSALTGAEFGFVPTSGSGVCLAGDSNKACPPPGS